MQGQILSQTMPGLVYFAVLPSSSWYKGAIRSIRFVQVGFQGQRIPIILHSVQVIIQI